MVGSWVASSRSDSSEGESMCGDWRGGRCFPSDCSRRESIKKGGAQPTEVLLSPVIVISISVAARIRPYVCSSSECSKMITNRVAASLLMQWK